MSPFLWALLLAIVLAGELAGAERVQTTLTPDAGTVGLWTFQEGQGDRTASAVNAPAGVLQGAVWVPGRTGYAVATRSGWVAMPDNPVLRPARALTVEVCAKLSRPEGDLVCKNSAYMMRLGGAMKAYLHVDKKWRTVEGARLIPVGRWTHLAMTYDSSTRTAALYVDGALDVRQTIPDLTTGLLDQGGAELRIGTNSWNPASSHVDGKVDGVRISNIARTFEPISNPQRPAPTPGINLAPNGDFELGLMGWRTEGEGDTSLIWTIQTTGASRGHASLTSIPGADGPQGILSRPIPVTPGTRYTVTARMRADAPGRKATLSLGAFGVASGTKIRSFSRSANLTQEWETVSLPVVLPADWGAPSACVRLVRPREGQMWVDDVRFFAGEGEGVVSLQDRIGVRATTERASNLFFVNQPGQIGLHIVNTDTRSHRVEVQACVANYEGRELPPQSIGTFDVPAGSEASCAYTVDTAKRGAFRLTFALATEGRTWRQAADLRYAVVLPLKGKGAAEPSAFGMNTHMERESTPHLDRNLEALSQCGVKWIRGWWGWGMAEKERGQFDWTEYDRQLAAVEHAGTRLMPILLRYYPAYEREWAGKTDGIQRPPYRMEEWAAFVRKVAERYRGRVTAWEVWNEPNYSGDDLSPKVYASILSATAPGVREADPKAVIVGFAGVSLDYMEKTLAQGVLNTMDVVSEHSYAELSQPEERLPERTKAARSLLARSGGEKPIWHTEQGVGADGEGYAALPLSEAEAAALYTRNFVVARSLDIRKYFWFSSQTSPTYGWAVFYEDYIPRPRLVALNACASFLEGTAFRRAYRLDKQTYAYLFDGAAPVCVVWHLDMAASLVLPLPASSIEAFDLMGNPLALAESPEARLALRAGVPVYLRGKNGVAAMEGALAKASVTATPPMDVAVSVIAGPRLQVTVTNNGHGLQDGIVEILAGAGAAQPATPQYFNSLPPGAKASFEFALPEGHGRGEVRVRCGDHEMWEKTEAYTF